MLLATVIRRFGLPILGIALVIVGIVLLATTQPASFGWSAYSPLAETVYRPMSSSTQTIVGVFLIVVGTITTAAWAVLVWRRRATAPGSDPEDPGNPLP